jgi:hypothetical protein
VSRQKSAVYSAVIHGMQNAGMSRFLGSDAGRSERATRTVHLPRIPWIRSHCSAWMLDIGGKDHKFGIDCGRSNDQKA